MKTLWTLPRSLGRRMIAAAIVAWCLLSPAAPLLQAISAADEACPCCKGGAASCSRWHHAKSESGMALDAVPSCGCGCALAPGVAPSAGPFAIPAVAAYDFFPAAEEELARAALPPVASKNSHCLYQRPPPRAGFLSFRAGGLKMKSFSRRLSWSIRYAADLPQQ
jgi:hypothetical protein